jgi:hypothetical protein
MAGVSKETTSTATSHMRPHKLGMLLPPCVAALLRRLLPSPSLRLPKPSVGCRDLYPDGSMAILAGYQQTINIINKYPSNELRFKLINISIVNRVLLVACTMAVWA